MAEFEREDGVTRDELVQRVALMEEMIAEGRRFTARYGWVYVMWGLVYVVATGWVLFLPFKYWAWPVCVAFGIMVSIIKGRRSLAGGGGASVRSRSIEAVWTAMGIAITLYIIAAIVSHHCGSQAYVSAILFFVGLAHATSAMILRWWPQGVAAGIWWGCGIAEFFITSERWGYSVFLVASFFGMILFGLYAMWLERRRAAALEQHHA
ncbi:MAG: hypothetical protein ACLQM6_02380 [Acidobacteriaceae bacterium]